jgi:hypothetical protein
MKHTRHLWIALLVVVALGAGLAIARAIAVPKSFGWRDGWQYRGDSLDEQRSLPLVHAAEAGCLSSECHGEKAAKDESRIVLKGGHASLACQACHGPAQAHVDSQGKESQSVACDDSGLCMLCHAQVAGRPASIKQIASFEEHKKEKSGEQEKTCVDCHDSHTCEQK